MEESRGKNFPFLIILLCFFSFSLVLYCQHRTLTESLIINGEVNIYITPIFSLQNQGIFANDFLMQYLLSRITKGYIFLFLFFGKFFDLIFLIKVMPFIFSILSAIFFFIIAKNIIKEDNAAFAASILFILHSWTFYVFQGTGPRAFVYPLFLPFLYYLYKNRYLKCLIFYILQILFYPPIALISLFTFLFINLRVEERKLKIRCSKIIVTLFFIILPILYFLQFSLSLDKYFGPLITWKQIICMPEYYHNGRDKIFFQGIVPFLKSHRVGLNFNNSYFFLLSVLAILLFFAKKNKYRFLITKEIKALLISSLFLYFLAFVFLLYLFFPARYLMFSLPIIICISIGVLLNIVMNSIRKRIVKGLIFYLFLGLVTLIYLPMVDDNTRDYRYLKGAIQYLSASPKDSIIAAPPHIAEPIPTFAKRKVLFSHEALLPFHLGYYTVMRERVFEFFDAYYSDSLERIIKFCSKYAVDYIVLNKRHFSKEFLQGKIYNEPFDSYVHALIKKRKDFVLDRIEKEKIVFKDNGVIIIKTSDFR